VQREIAAATAASTVADGARLQRLLALNDYISYAISRYDAFTGRAGDGAPQPRRAV
jgi:hypothetical protein